LYDKKRGFWHNVTPPHKHFVIASRIYYTSFGYVSPRISRELEANKSSPQSAVLPEDALNILKKLLEKELLSSSEYIDLILAVKNSLNKPHACGASSWLPHGFLSS
jgi:hypothetical protein